MIIECELLKQPRTYFVESTWTHSPLDPLAVEVKFGIDGPTWLISVDLLMEAFTSSSEGPTGLGDVQIEVGENFTFLYLSNGQHEAVLQFSSADIESFLNQVSTQDPEEVIARELDEFLETL